MDTLKEVQQQAAAIDASTLLRYVLLAALPFTALYAVVYATYNLFFHPLAGFPGPFLARASLLWRFWHSMGGRFHRAIDEQHKRYGDVLRVSPNELSFISPASWKAIYGHAQPGRQVCTKSEFYDMYGSGFKSLCIGSEREPRRHGQMKRNLTASFSTKALLDQEEIVQRCVHGFIDRLSRESAGGEPVDMTAWYEMITFDILGEMSFGESFHCIEEGKPHFWIDLILRHLYFITLMDNLRRYPLFATIGRYLLPHLTTSVRDRHSGYSRRKVAERLAQGKSGRKDFLTNVASKVESGDISREEMTAHASTLIIAGGETTSTFLAAATYHLLRRPETYARLVAEVRGRFKHPHDVDATSAQQLPYLQAVISEGLRIYPPGSQGFPRLSPGQEIDGYYVPAGAEVYTSAWSVTHDDRNFHDPFAFRPERWLDPACTDVKDASQPFSLGPRGCLGRNFAHMEIGLLMTNLLLRFDLESVDESLDWEGSSLMYVMWWKPHLMIRLRERTLE